MSNSDETQEITSHRTEVTNGEQLKVLARRITIGIVTVLSVGLLICVGLLIQAFITHKPICSLIMDFSQLNANCDLLSYISSLVILFSFLLLVIISNLSVIIKNKKILYFLGFIGSFLLFASLGFLLLNHQTEEQL